MTKEIEEDFVEVIKPSSDILTIFDEVESSNDKEVNDDKQKLISKIQIGLIIFLIVFGTLFYFFGYNLVEPFIKI